MTDKPVEAVALEALFNSLDPASVHIRPMPSEDDRGESEGDRMLAECIVYGFEPPSDGYGNMPDLAEEQVEWAIKLGRALERAALTRTPTPLPKLTGDAPDDVVEALRHLVRSVDDLIAESEGVYGLHLNGDPAPWASLTEGGRFEAWLIELERARAALAAMPAPPSPDDAEYRCGLCGAQADERYDCCAITSAPPSPDARQAHLAQVRASMTKGDHECVTVAPPSPDHAELTREQTIEAVQTLLERGKATLNSDGYLVLVDPPDARAKVIERMRYFVECIAHADREGWNDATIREANAILAALSPSGQSGGGE